MTIVQGAAGGARRAEPSVTCRGLSSMWLLRPAGGIRLEMPAEFVAHGREQLVGETVRSARAEARIKSRREHFGPHPLLDRRHHRPAPLARILHEPAIGFERRIPPHPRARPT